MLILFPVHVMFVEFKLIYTEILSQVFRIFVFFFNSLTYELVQME